MSSFVWSSRALRAAASTTASIALSAAGAAACLRYGGGVLDALGPALALPLACAAGATLAWLGERVAA